MVTFDDVLPELVRICEETNEFKLVERATVVRDLRGKVRLVLKFQDDQSIEVGPLESSLQAKLGPWFAPPILGPKTRAGRLRGVVLKMNAPWQPSWDDPIKGRQVAPAGRWHRIERHLSKVDWLAASKARLEWPLVSTKPPIVTFYSFKGGVGRTTLLISIAWQLALEGKRVAIVDLDVEAPGLSSLLGVETRRGVLDFLNDFSAIDEASLEDAIAPAAALGDAAKFIDVVPAGRLSLDYFEKLARLDFLGSGLFEPSTSPVEQGLRGLMRCLAKREPRPDYIFLDSRAGLHDLAGMSLTDLAHVDVLVGRDSDQAYRGLDLTISALSKRRSADDFRCLVVQSLAPDDPGSEEYKRAAQEYRQRSHESFQRHIYSAFDKEEDEPALDDDTAPHWPLVIRFQQRLLQFTAVTQRRDELLSTDFVAVKQRLVELCAPESGSTE